jgi:hypothetical protein
MQRTETFFFHLFFALEKLPSKVGYFSKIEETHIFGAFGAIMFALWALVGFGASWRGEFLIPASCSEGNIAHVWKDTWQHVRKDTF